MSMYKSISRRATRTQLLRIYAAVLKESERKKFDAFNATRTFRKWFHEHDKLLDKLLLSAYIEELFSEMEDRMKDVKVILKEHGCLDIKEEIDG